MSGFNFFGDQKDMNSEENKNKANTPIEFSSSEAEDKKEDVNPLDMFADSALADANNDDVPLIGEEEEVSYTEGSNASEDDEDYDDVEDGEEFISEDEDNNNEGEEEEEKEGDDNDEYSNSDGDSSVSNGGIVEKALEVAAKSEEEPITHFDQILSDVSKIKNDNKEQELSEKNTFLLNTVMKLSQQASHFKNRVSENILENHQLVDDFSQKLAKKDAALENLQVDIKELEQDVKESEALKNSLKKKYDELKKSKNIEIQSLHEDLIRAESSNKQLHSEMEIKVEHTNKDQITIGKLEEDNTKLRKDIEILGYKMNTTEETLKSEIEFKNLHISKLQNQIQSFHQIGVKNNVSVDDYNQLVESFKESTDEIDRLKDIIDDREHDLKMLLTKNITESTDDFNSIDILKKELMLEKLEKDTLTKQIEEIVKGLENTLNESKDYKQVIDTLETQLLNSNALLESIENDRNDIFNENIKDKATVEKLEKILAERDQLITDLSSQVQYVLLQLTLRTDSDSLSILSKDELNKIKKLTKMNRNKSGSNGNMNIQDVISDNLVLFKDIDNLQKQNQNLVVSLRELGYKLESLQSIKESEELNNDLKSKTTELQQQIDSLENKKLISEQELENLQSLIETNKDYKSKAQTDEIVKNYKVQIEHLEKQLELALDKVLKSSEESSKSLIDNMTKITELNVEIGDLKTLNKTSEYQLKQALQDKESLSSLLKKEETLRDELHKHNTDLLIRNKEWETSLMETQESLKNAEAENINLNKTLKSVTVDNQSIQNENVKLSNQVSEMNRKMDNIERLRKDMEYLLRHSDEDYWENLALLEKKIKNSEDKEVVNSENNYDSVKHILNAFEKHMAYHSNQASELRKLLQEKNDIIEKLNVDSRVSDLVAELDIKKNEYEELQKVLDSYKQEYSEEKTRLELSNNENTQQLNHLQQEIVKLNGDIQNRDTSISELNDKIVTLKNEVEESKKSLESLNVEFKQKVRNLEIDYDELEHTCKEYEERNKSLSDEKDEAVKSLEELAKKDEAAKSLEEVAKKDEAAKSLEEVAKKDEEITVLKEQIDALKGELSTKETPETNEDEVNSLKKEIEDLKKQIEAKNETEKVDEDAVNDKQVEEVLRKEVESLSTKKIELEEKVKSLEAENREQRASVLKVKLLEQKLKMLSNNAPAVEKSASSAAPLAKEPAATPAFSFNIPKESDVSSTNTFAMNSIPQKQAPAFLGHDESKDSSSTANNSTKRALENENDEGEKRVKKEESKESSIGKELSSEKEEIKNVNEFKFGSGKPEEEASKKNDFKFDFDQKDDASKKNDFKFGFGNPETDKKNDFKFGFGQKDEASKNSVFGFPAGNAFNGSANSNPFGNMNNNQNAFSFGSKPSRFESFTKKDENKKEESEEKK